ncbi:GNAT family N-acetyltransferase [Paenibacillus lycopersici]|uniref:GNAT family N-acetyltransferase n=1 Tax=Paenibacillus lycopersici TaxID=2704462 RepID=A0A6C0FV89_9BACL|nr:GNAT family protein [Paenibacillus lycopersici]QHT59224.1 GNAT family N-acetyltransferase [Paenibacillus lycopersici]
MRNAFFEQDIVLENPIVRVVPFDASYEDGLRRIIFDKEITRFTQEHILSDEDLKRYIASTEACRANGSGYPFIVIDKASGQVAGATRFGNLVFPSKRLEIGWTWYGKAYRGTGINKAVKFELLRYAFETLGFNRVQFSVDLENVRSQKAVLKLGAKQEGIFRSNYENASGEPRDDVYFSIIKPEWPDVKSGVFEAFVSAGRFT